ncbi:kinesin-like protein KIF9 [Pteronotus mesoamericanus]|uniref:kinesin-like protein KIF9 n=1 Tax=Pteronotus mesoamericanus TaxID=1884717 RepID=UPI0023EB80DB|nr:kinesin-like protein KIF9 [Pteronotus parnellii mesoamericanus]
MNTRKKIHAFVHIKSTNDFAHEMIRYRDDNQITDVQLKKDTSPGWYTRRGVINSQQRDCSFKLDKVLHHASQDLVYETGFLRPSMGIMVI